MLLVLALAHQMCDLGIIVLGVMASACCNSLEALQHYSIHWPASAHPYTSICHSMMMTLSEGYMHMHGGSSSHTSHEAVLPRREAA